MSSEDSPPRGPAAVRGRLVELLGARLPWLDTMMRRGPLAFAGACGMLVVAAALTWWAVRPAPHPPIETVLPRAGATAGASTSGASAPGTGASGGDAPVGSGATGAALVVHVVGAVGAPGVVRVPAGSRVLDAVAAAGGLAPGADVARVNLAAKLTDGQRVVVPVVGESPPALAEGSSGGDGSAAPGDPAVPVNLNEATAAQLDTLPGVGPSTAAAIIAHRVAHGPFRTVDALGEVRGIGPAKLEQLRPLVTV